VRGSPAKVDSTMSFLSNGGRITRFYLILPHADSTNFLVDENGPKLWESYLIKDNLYVIPVLTHHAVTSDPNTRTVISTTGVLEYSLGLIL
jgi:hypothetical protein